MGIFNRSGGHTAPQSNVGIGRRIFLWFAPDARKAEDGRDMFGSRATFVLCAMGGAVGLGNLLRFPSIVYNNYGLQFFIPYLIALFFIALPVLILEISIGATYRGGCVNAWNGMNRRARGIGLAVVFNGYAVVTYYIPLLAWVMKYFRRSFISPLPWAGQDLSEYFSTEIVANTAATVTGELNADGSVAFYSSYDGFGLLGETVGWAIFTWFVTWLCVFRGVGLTGRVIYITMGLPFILIIILIGRGASLPNASEGIKLYFATWRTGPLQAPGIWQDAFGQIFFSIGVGFGYFTSWASYCSKHSNAVQDAIIIAFSNSMVEICAAFAVFGVIGFLGLDPSDGERLGTFVTGFITYPEALAQMPAANFFSVIFFLTLFLLGLTSAFSLLEVMTTLILDTDWGKRFPRWQVSTTVTILSALISLIYCTEIGLNLLDAVDTFVNSLALFFVVWCECFAATSMYRWRDVADQTGLVAYLVFTSGLVLAQILGIGISYAAQPYVGAPVGFAIFIITSIAGTLLAKTPSIAAPGFFGRNSFLTRFWWIAFYPGHQLTQDLNVVIGVGKNWDVPFFWAPVMKYISSPILAIVFSFAFDPFRAAMYEPTYIYGFSIMHLVFPMIAMGLIFPGWYNFIVPSAQDLRGVKAVAPMEVIDESDDMLARRSSPEDNEMVMAGGKEKTEV